MNPLVFLLDHLRGLGPIKGRVVQSSAVPMVGQGLRREYLASSKLGGGSRAARRWVSGITPLDAVVLAMGFNSG